jgi:hypothetical protein
VVSVKASAISKAQHQMERGKGRRCFVIHHAPFPISSTFRHPHQLMIRCILYASCIRPLFVILLQPVAAGGWYASPTLQATSISLCCSCGNAHCFSSCVLCLLTIATILPLLPILLTASGPVVAPCDRDAYALAALLPSNPSVPI